MEWKGREGKAFENGMERKKEKITEKLQVLNQQGTKSKE